jgi:ectoine hydroxylase-related dioxygenase (phytanoyl-CoA dioxygenase family)
VLSIAGAEDEFAAVPPDLFHAFWQQGFVAFDDFVSAAELSRLSADVDEAIGKAAQDPGAQSGSGHRGDAARGELVWVRRPETHVAALADSAAVRRARRFAAALLRVAEDRIGVSTRIFAKPPRTGSIVPWHQDAGYRPDEPDRKSVNLWIALDDATIESGCLHFAAGSHRGPIRGHRAYGRDPTGLTLETESPDAPVVACPIGAGAASAHHYRTLHHSPANLSHFPRRALVVVCEVVKA